MAEDIGQEDGRDAGVDDASDTVARLVQVSNRSCILAIDQLLHDLPRDTTPDATAGRAAAVADAVLIARRMTRATRDFGATAAALFFPPTRTH